MLAWRTKPRTLRERLALWLIGKTPVMANVRLSRVDCIEAGEPILAGPNVTLSDDYHAHGDVHEGYRLLRDELEKLSETVEASYGGRAPALMVSGAAVDTDYDPGRDM